MATTQLCVYPNTFTVAAFLKYANFAAFPSSAINGTVAEDLSTNLLYSYNTNSSSWVIVNGLFPTVNPSGVMSANSVNYFTNGTSNLVTLPASPALGTVVKCRVNNAVGGTFKASTNTGQSGIYASGTFTSALSTGNSNAIAFEAIVGGASAMWIAIVEQGTFTFT